MFLFFWKLNKHKQKQEKADQKQGKAAPEIETPQEVSGIRKYKTNYYSANSVKRREALRSKKQRKNEIGEYKLEVELAHLPKSFKRLSNLLLSTEQGFVQIDHLLISPHGFFVIEVYNLAGLIVGEEEDKMWHQAIGWRVKSFSNPLEENQLRIKVLQELGNLDEQVPFFSYVTFNRRCNLKVFSGKVFYDIDLIAAINKLSLNLPVVLSEEEIQEYVVRFEACNITDQGVRNEYLARQRKERIRQRPKYGDIRCRSCHKAVSERIARYCLNHPEKFAWRIYCEKHQKEMTRLRSRKEH